MIFLPVILIILVVFFVNALYFQDTAPKDITKKSSFERSDTRKEYLDKYLKP